MFSSKEFEKCWFLYQSEGLPYNLSIEEFCLKQGVPVNEFNKRFRDTHKRIHPIQVEKNRYIEFLIQQKEERDRTIADKDAFIKNLQETLDMLKSMHESDSKKIDDLMASHEQDSLKIDQMLSQINDLTAQLKLKNKQTYADKSQKGISKKGKVDSTTKPKDRDRDEERENFDGTNCEKPSDPSEIPAEETTSP